MFQGITTAHQMRGALGHRASWLHSGQVGGVHRELVGGVHRELVGGGTIVLRLLWRLAGVYTSPT